MEEVSPAPAMRRPAATLTLNAPQVSANPLHDHRSHNTSGCEEVHLEEGQSGEASTDSR